jgi:glycolate oxidase FAD binding subunit
VGADPVLGALAAACPAARPAGAGDAVAGVMPRFAASPATVAEAGALLAAAAAADLTVVPRGGGSKLGWGAPPRRCDLVVDTTALDQVVEHAAGDLVARVQAGVSVARLREVLAGAGQQLALDPPPAVPGAGAAAGADVAAGLGAAARVGATAGSAGPPEADGTAREWLGATVGGTLATGAAGPRRLRYGTPRDLVIGITVVRADGTVAKSGGKVVKNVAGYDLGRLFTGSFGTLGLIVEAVFRLHPLPASAAYVTVDCPGPDEAYRAVAAAAGSGLAPSAVEIDRVAHGAPVRVAVLLEGDPDGTAERAALLCSLLGDGAAAWPSPPAWWGWPAAGNTWAGANGQPGDGGSAPGDGSALGGGSAVGGAGQPGGGSATGRAGQPGGGSAGSAPGGPGGPGQTGTLVRIAFWAAALPRVVRVIDAAARAAGLDPAVGGSAAAGVIYAGTGPEADPAAVAAFVAGLRAALARGDADARPATAPAPDSPPVLASAVVVHAPPGVRDSVDPWGPVPSLPLMRAVKDQFDPGHRMAPGRFAGGI